MTVVCRCGEQFAQDAHHNGCYIFHCDACRTGLVLDCVTVGQWRRAGKKQVQIMDCTVIF